MRLWISGWNTQLLSLSEAASCAAPKGAACVNGVHDAIIISLLRSLGQSSATSWRQVNRNRNFSDFFSSVGAT